MHINILSLREAKKRNKTNKKCQKASADGKQDWCRHTTLSREKNLKRNEKRQRRVGSLEKNRALLFQRKGVLREREKLKEKDGGG